MLMGKALTVTARCAGFITKEPCAIGFRTWFPVALGVSSRRMSAEDTNSLIEQRKAKLASLRAKGIDPFKNKFTPTETCKQARDNYTEGREVALAGRITAHREMGKSQFIDIRDQSGRMQVYAQKNVLGEEQWSIFTHLDLADFIGVKGTLFTTKTGEISVKLASFVILAKALRPPPAKWHGLEDTEIRYRQRYLDLIGNPDVKEVFLKRSAIVHEIRAFFHSRGYVEVETPAMQAIPGGAAAQPFKTFHNALGCEFYLRIALELYHKRLLVGGIDKLFEIGKNFRNEGLSRRHNPEFTMLEAYQAFGDYETMMEVVESLICHVAQKVLGTLRIQHDQTNEVRAAMQSSFDILADLSKQAQEASLLASTAGTTPSEIDNLHHSCSTIFPQLTACKERLTSGNAAEVAAEVSKLFDQGTLPIMIAKSAVLNTFREKLGAEIDVINRVRRTSKNLERLSSPKIIDLTPPWPRVKYKDLVKKVGGNDWFDISPQERRHRAVNDLKLGGDIAMGYVDFEVTGAVFEKLIEPTLIQPTFVTHLPKELVPLAKLSPDDPTTVEVFECCINGQEISPGYTEQNDPIAQRTTLEHQAGGEQQKLDEDFLVALEHGMPPAGGIGIGIDRLCMMLLGQESIRDVILFPQLKPKS
jgi:lysyl-tRNA synthetase class 2